METPQGLILGHGYNVTKVLEVEVAKKLQGKIGSPKLFMIRLANPWGTKEWSGPWSDGYGMTYCYKLFTNSPKS